MAESIVSLTYGTALYEAARELGKEEEILIEVKQLALIVKAYEQFAAFLNSPAIMPKEKQEAVKHIMQDSFSPEMIHFVYVLIDKGRTAEIRKIAKQYIRLYDEERGIAEGKVFSVVQLTAGSDTEVCSRNVPAFAQADQAGKSCRPEPHRRHQDSGRRQNDRSVLQRRSGTLA